MADSTTRSNIKGKAGTETISNFASVEVSGDVGAATVTATGAISGASETVTGAVKGATVEGTTSATSPIITASSYLKIGSRYVFSGSQPNQASILAEATALLGTNLGKKGSLYVGDGTLWVFTTNATVAKINATALTGD